MASRCFFSDSDLKQIRETEIIKFLALRKIQFFARLPEKNHGKNASSPGSPVPLLVGSLYARNTPDAYEMQLLCKMIFAPSFIKKQLNVRHANLITLLCGRLGWQQACCQCRIPWDGLGSLPISPPFVVFSACPSHRKLFYLNILWPCNGPRTQGISMGFSMGIKQFV